MTGLIFRNVACRVKYFASIVNCVQYGEFVEDELIGRTWWMVIIPHPSDLHV